MGSRLAQVFLSSLVLWSVASAQTLAERNAELLRDLQEMHELSPEQMARIKAIFAGSRIIGQGNPAITQHPLTPEQCTAKLRTQGVNYANPGFERVCGRRYMAPLYNPATQAGETAALANRLSSSSSLGNWRIFTANSTGSPSPPKRAAPSVTVIGQTSR
jgi:hypothetical protein